MTRLWIKGLHKLRTIKNFPRVEQLQVSKNDNLRMVSNLGLLQKLGVHGYPLLENARGLHSLQTIFLEYVEMESLPVWLESPFSKVEMVKVNGWRD